MTSATALFTASARSGVAAAHVASLLPGPSAHSKVPGGTQAGWPFGKGEAASGGGGPGVAAGGTGVEGADGVWLRSFPPPHERMTTLAAIRARCQRCARGPTDLQATS